VSRFEISGHSEERSDEESALRSRCRFFAPLALRSGWLRATQDSAIVEKENKKGERSIAIGLG
jgi:hypothetical protein